MPARFHYAITRPCYSAKYIGRSTGRTGLRRNQASAAVRRPKLEPEHDKLYDERLRKTAEINSMGRLLSDNNGVLPTVATQLHEREDHLSRMDVWLQQLKTQIAQLKS